jgi:GNAT superfamily N-acetyltransferase
VDQRPDLPGLDGVVLRHRPDPQPAPRHHLTSITIRSAEPADTPRIATLLEQLGYPATVAAVRARLDDWSADRRGLVLVADVAGVVAGVAALHAIPLLERDGHRARLVALVVDDAYGGQGLGRALVTAAEREARRLGCRDMEITSSRERDAAHRFYRRAGYADTCGSAARFLKVLDN